MPNINDLKEKLKSDENFRNKFLKIKDSKEAIELARKFGFNVNEKDIENDPEISEDILEAVAGGKAVDVVRRGEKLYVFADDAEANVIKRSEYENGGGI